VFVKKDLSSQGKIETIIGKGTEITGSISGQGIIRLDGKVTGMEVRYGEVIVGESGEVAGDIEAKQITVAGLVRGNITADSKVEIVGTGKVIGNICSERLLISEGAVFHGTCDMKIDHEFRTEKSELTVGTEI
jgi:cytoskeletal protein CcmA (bactofilin family)